MKIGELEEKNHDLLTALFIRNGLEFSENEPIPTDVIGGWQATEGDLLAGGCILALREGSFIIDGIAVEPEFRNTDIGSLLLQKALKLAAEKGGDSVYLVARAPGFFRKHDFVTIGRDEGPLFFECFTCPQYNVSCFPEVMRVSLNKSQDQG